MLDLTSASYEFFLMKNELKNSLENVGANTKYLLQGRTP